MTGIVVTPDIKVDVERKQETHTSNFSVCDIKYEILLLSLCCFSWLQCCW